MLNLFIILYLYLTVSLTMVSITNKLSIYSVAAIYHSMRVFSEVSELFHVLILVP